MTTYSQCISTILIVVGSWAKTIRVISVIVVNITRAVHIEHIRIPVGIAERKIGQPLKRVSQKWDYPNIK